MKKHPSCGAQKRDIHLFEKNIYLLFDQALESKKSKIEINFGLIEKASIHMKHKKGKFYFSVINDFIKMIDEIYKTLDEKIKISSNY